MKPVNTLYVTLLAFAFSAHAATIIQGTGQDYVKFEAGSYFSLSNTGTSVITDNLDGSLTTTSRDESNPALLTYQIDFDTTGNYYLYFNATAPAGNADSLFVTSDFDATPSTANENSWNNLQNVGGGSGTGWVILDGAAGTGVQATDDANPTSNQGTDYNGVAVGVSAQTFDLASSGSPVELRFRPRENGLTWNNFVLSTDAGLTATELDGLAFSVIPEPSTLVLFGIASVAMLLNSMRRR